MSLVDGYISVSATKAGSHWPLGLPQALAFPSLLCLGLTLEGC